MSRAQLENQNWPMDHPVVESLHASHLEEDAQGQSHWLIAQQLKAIVERNPNLTEEFEVELMYRELFLEEDTDGEAQDKLVEVATAAYFPDIGKFEVIRPGSNTPTHETIRTPVADPGDLIERDAMLPERTVKIVASSLGLTSGAVRARISENRRKFGLGEDLALELVITKSIETAVYSTYRYANGDMDDDIGMQEQSVLNRIVEYPTH